jgi:hypothetical protein
MPQNVFRILSNVGLKANQSKLNSHTLMPLSKVAFKVNKTIPEGLNKINVGLTYKSRIWTLLLVERQR